MKGIRLAQIEREQTLREHRLHVEGKTRLTPRIECQIQRFDEIDANQHHHATDDEGLLAGIAYCLDSRLERRIVTREVALREQSDRWDHQTDTQGLQQYTDEH